MDPKIARAIEIESFKKMTAAHEALPGTLDALGERLSAVEAKLESVLGMLQGYIGEQTKAKSGATKKAKED